MDNIKEISQDCNIIKEPSSIMSYDKIRFGKYDWIVIEKRDKKILIVTEKIIMRSPYHNGNCEITWENSNIRRYLNNEFYDSFSAIDRTRIVEAVINNFDNQWDGTNGGNATRDHIFLLSIEEVVKYFGDSGHLRVKPTGSKGESWWIDDQYNNARTAKFCSKNAWWWLRSPGFVSNRAAYIMIEGLLRLHGETVNSKLGGIRPALWLKLKN